MSFKEIANPSTMFLLPGLGLTIGQLDKYGFISAYVDDLNHEIKYESSVFLLFKPTELNELQRFITSEYKRTNLLKEDYDYEGGYVVMAYTFPEAYFLDYEQFLFGHYSRFSEGYKKLFPTFTTIKYEDGKVEETYALVHHIFKKSEGLRKHLSRKFFGEDENGKPIEYLDKSAELWSAPDLEVKDMLDINKIRDLVTLK